MPARSSLALAAPFLLLPLYILRAAGPADECCALDLWTGEGVAIGRVLIPEVTFMSAFGGSTAEDGALAVGHHDPDRDGMTIQNVEFSLSANLGANAHLFATYASKVDLDDRWADSLEEYYLSVSALPLDARLKAGRFYTKFGYQNQLHPHAFTFVDQYLANGRFLGEDSATVIGAEIAVPILRGLGPKWSDLLTVSFGAVPDGEEEAEEGEEAEVAFEGEGALFQDHLATADYTLTFAASAASQYQIGVSGAWGKNNFDRQTQVYGLHLEYLWRPQAPGGKETVHADHGDHAGHAHASGQGGKSGEFFRWRTEAVARRFGAVGTEVDDDTAPGSAEKLLRRDFTDAGFYTALSYGFPGGNVEAHLRGEYVSGVAEAGLIERWRISPAVTWRPKTRLPIHFKVQYNYDRSPSFGEEHSVWAQFNLTWGDCCAHAH